MSRLKKIKPVRDIPQDIETIINSFEKFAFSDIKYTQPKPIAAFILSICFIEQLSTFLYEFNANDNEKPERFFRRYMPEYKDIDLYDKARHRLVHNYSSRYQFDIDNRGHENVPYKIINDVIHINTDVFIHYLEIAFEKAVKDLRIIDGERYNNALENSKYYPVLIDTHHE